MAHPVSIVGILKAGAVVTIGALLFFRSLRKSNAPGAAEEDDTIEPIDLEALERAERQATMSIEEQRQALDEDFVLWARIPTQSMSESAMLEWTEKAQAKSLRVKVLFEPALSAKGARSQSVSGFFELYIHRDDFDRIEEIEAKK